MNDLATKVGMSLRNFKRRFAKATGDTPLAYVQRYRVEAAKRLLESTDKGVSAVCY